MSDYKISIAVIRKNRCSFDNLEQYLRPLLYVKLDPQTKLELRKKLDDYIWDTISPFIEFIDVSDVNDFITNACIRTTEDFPDRKPDTDFYFHTESSYSFPKRYIELFHAQPLWKDYVEAQESNMNNIGCFFSLKHTVIENTCIIIANGYNINSQQPIVPVSITKEDIIRVIRRRFYFSGIVIESNIMTKYYYQDPIILVSKIFNIGSDDNIQMLNTDLLKYNLKFFFMYNKEGDINKIATRINGSFRLYGKAIMICENDPNVYVNLSMREAKRLNVMAYGRMCDRNVSDNEVKMQDTVGIGLDGNVEEKKTPALWNKYILMEKRMDKWRNNKHICVYCNVNVDNKSLICTKCYRVRYCSKQCQTDFKSYHDDECINPASVTY